MKQPFRVLVYSQEAGEEWFVGREVAESVLFLEMSAPLAVGLKVLLRYQRPDADAAVCVTGKVGSQASHKVGSRTLVGIHVQVLGSVFADDVAETAPASEFADDDPRSAVYITRALERLEAQHVAGRPLTLADDD